MESQGQSRRKCIADDEWAKMKIMISDRLDNVTSNLDELRESGSLEAIAQIIERGDRCPSARLQAWYHGMLEVEFCNRPYSASQKLQRMYKIHGAAGPDAAPQSFILGTSMAAPSAGSEESKIRSGRLLENAESVVGRLEGKNNLDVVERQELWLAKKHVKAAQVQCIIEQEKMNKRAQSAPDLSRSRRSFVALAKENKMAAKYLEGVASKRLSTAVPKKPSRTHARKHSGTTAARKRSVAAANPGANSRSLDNITNQTVRKRHKRQSHAK